MKIPVIIYEEVTKGLTLPGFDREVKSMEVVNIGGVVYLKYIQGVEK